MLTRTRRHLAALALALPTLAQASAPAPRAALEEDLRRMLEEAGVPGAVFAVVGKDAVRWRAAFGVDPETFFAMGSVSKSVVALGLTQLDERGILPLTTDVRDVVPEVSFDAPPGVRVTIAHLLEHTSGLQDEWPRWLEPAASPMTPLADLLAAWPARRRLAAPPGTTLIYSQDGYLLAARALERATGDRFDAYLAREVMRPAGMTTATFEPDEAVKERTTPGHAGRRPLPLHEVRNRPAGGLKANVDDMAQLVRMHLGAGTVDGRTVLSEATMARVEREETSHSAAAGLVDGYGLGNNAVPTRYGFFRGHGGGAGGVIVGFVYDRGRDYGLVSLLSQQYGPTTIALIRKLGHRIHAEFLGPPPAPDAAPLPPEIVPDEWTGPYRTVNGSVRLRGVMNDLLGLGTVTATDGALWLSLAGGPATRIGGGVGRQLVHGEDPALPAVLGRLPDGRRFLRVGEGMGIETTALGAWSWRIFWLVEVGALAVAFFAGAWSLATRRRSWPAATRRERTLAVSLLVVAIAAAATKLVVVVGLEAFGSLGMASEVNAITLTFFVSSVTFVATSVGAFLAAAGGLVMHRRDRVLALALLASLFCLAMNAYLASHGVVGMGLWGSFG